MWLGCPSRNIIAGGVRRTAAVPSLDMEAEARFRTDQSWATCSESGRHDLVPKFIPLFMQQMYTEHQHMPGTGLVVGVTVAKAKSLPRSAYILIGEEGQQA